MTDSFGLLNLSKLKINDKIIIDEEIKLAKQLEQETLELLNKNKDKLKKIANSLLKKETLYEKDLDKIIFGIKEKNFYENS